MKTIKERHFVIEYVIPESDKEEKEIKKIIREVELDCGKIDLSQFKIDKPEDREWKNNGSERTNIFERISRVSFFILPP